MWRKYSSSNSAGSVFFRSLKAWIGPCSLSKSGRPSGVAASASSISAPTTTAGATVSRGSSMVRSA
jgi:hypothetical protein